MGVGFALGVIIILIQLAAHHGYLPKSKFIDMLGYHCFTPLFISMILAYIYNDHIRTKRFKGRTKGKIIRYEYLSGNGRLIDYEDYISGRKSSRKYYNTIPIAEYVVDGITYRCVSNKRGNHVLSKDNEEVIIKYNLDNPSDAIVKYNIKQFFDLNTSIICEVIVFIIMYFILKILGFI